MPQLSRRFLTALKLGALPAYRVAQLADPPIHPATLSKLVSGAERLKPLDPRIVAVGRVLGLSAEECFAQEEDAPATSSSPRISATANDMR